MQSTYNLTESQLQKISNDFKALADESRIKIILFLLDGEKSVNTISTHLSIGQSATSHHLRILKDAGILRVKREGNINYYYISDRHIEVIMQMSLEHLGC